MADFTIQIEEFSGNIGDYIFSIHNTCPIVVDVQGPFSNYDYPNDPILLIQVPVAGGGNTNYYQGLIIEDISNTRRKYVIYMDNIIRPYMPKIDDFEQSVDFEVEVENVIRQFVNCQVFLGVASTGATYTPISNPLYFDFNALHAVRQFGEIQYIAERQELAKYAYDPNTGFTTPYYNYDIYHAAKSNPFYVYFLINDELSAYYDYYIGGEFFNAYALDYDYNVFTSHSGTYFIV